MAVTEGDGGRPKKKLPSWDTVEKSDPRAIAGTKGYDPKFRPPPPSPVAIPGARFDRSRLRDLTPYAAPRTVEIEPRQPAASTGGRMAAYEMLGQGGTPERYEAPSTGGRLAAYKLLGQSGGGDGEPDPTIEERPGKERTRREYRLTWDEYNKLNDEQKAAIDFNTLLVQAREKDLNSDYAPTEQQEEQFRKQSERMFGEGRGSDTFAPETLAVLKQIDFKSSGEEDLDDFIDLRYGVSMKDLKNFSLNREVKPPELPDSRQTALVREAISPGGAGGLNTEQRAAKYSENLRASMARANELLQTWRASAADNRYGITMGLGGDPQRVQRETGYKIRPPFEDADADGKADKYGFNAYLQDMLGALSAKDRDPGEVLGWLETDLKTRDQVQTAMRFFDEQTANAIRTGTNVYGMQGKDVRGAQEIRKLLGLNRGDSNAR